ncbi:hypothetical protein [Streptomyces sp. NPDC048606]|uniref:hypothetical protein n=1 Tax=Streptomyces sp. NPDC048606 TaxID=3154726 RepID=UPI00342222B4
MGAFGRMDITVKAHTLVATRWTWGTQYAPERRWVDGWGTEVETPVVIQLLDLVAAGEVSAKDARDALAAAAAKLIRTHDPDEADPREYAAARCYGDCERCRARRPEFEAIHARALVEKAKGADTLTYPYAVTRNGLHRSDCPHITDTISHIRGYEMRDLKSFVHEDEEHSGWAAFSTFLDRNEAAAWVAERCGPRGGRQYRLCRICSPEHP